MGNAILVNDPFGYWLSEWHPIWGSNYLHIGTPKVIQSDKTTDAQGTYENFGMYAGDLPEHYIICKFLKTHAREKFMLEENQRFRGMRAQEKIATGKLHTTREPMLWAKCTIQRVYKKACHRWSRAPGEPVWEGRTPQEKAHYSAVHA